MKYASQLSHARAMQSAQANEEGEIQSESSDKKSGKKVCAHSILDLRCMIE